MILDRSKISVALVWIIILLLIASAGSFATRSFNSRTNMPLQSSGADYVGPDTCKTCHPEIYEEWEESLHSKMIRKLTPELIREYGLTEEDLEAHGITIGPNFPFVIGGHWKLRFINATADPDDPSKWTVAIWQFTIATREWVPYHPEAPKDWGKSCAQCHVTGFKSDTETFWGSIEQLATSISCESCHGPGGYHVTNPTEYEMIIDVSAEVCGQCHVRGTFPEYELGKPETFSYTPGEKPHKHHQQYRDWLISAHSRSMEPEVREIFRADFCLQCHSADNIFNTNIITKVEVKYTLENATNPVTCVNCHDPHELNLWISHGPDAGKPADEMTVCGQCHTGLGTPEEKVKEEWHHPQIEMVVGSTHGVSGVTCVDCHMALDTKSAVAYDLRNHSMIVESYGTYEYTCGQSYDCHKKQLEENPEWAEERIEEIEEMVEASLERTAEAIKSAEEVVAEANKTPGVDKTAVDKAADLLLRAKSFYSFVEADGSHGFHNPKYALQLLNIALDYAAQSKATALEALSSTLEGRVANLEGEVSRLQSRVGELEESLATVTANQYMYAILGLVVGLVVGAGIAYLIKKKS